MLDSPKNYHSSPPSSPPGSWRPARRLARRAFGPVEIFFFVVRLEIRREIQRGELSELRRAALPLAAPLTMATFIAQLAFPAGANLETAKLAILIGSVVAALAGYFLGRAVLPQRAPAEAESSPKEFAL